MAENLPNELSPSSSSTTHIIAPNSQLAASPNTKNFAIGSLSSMNSGTPTPAMNNNNNNNNSMNSSIISNISNSVASSSNGINNSTNSNQSKLIDKQRLTDLAKEVDPLLQLDDEVEELLMMITDDFIDNVVSSSCDLAKNRKSNSLEAKDIQLVLERNHNIWIPGYSNEEIRPTKKSHMAEAHKQRLNLIKKTLKKL